jgi:hypothetical protein
MARGSVGMSLPVSSRPNVRVNADATNTTLYVTPAFPAPARWTGSRAPDPEVLLEPGETRALRSLIAGVREGHIDLTPVTEASTPSVMEFEPIRDIAIAPIVIAPVEGVRQ